MSAHTNSPEAGAAIQAMAKRIDEYRAQKKWTQVRLLREFPGLGSSKVYWACQQGQTEELDLEDTWLPQYRAVIALIEAEIADPVTDEQLYDDLIPVSELARVVGPIVAGFAYPHLRNTGQFVVAAVISVAMGVWTLGLRRPMPGEAEPDARSEAAMEQG